MEIDDEVVKEIDVFLTKELLQKLWLFQYPVRPVDSDYEEEQFLTTKVKPMQKKVHLELSLDTSADTYCGSKGEHFARSVDGPTVKGPLSYESGKLDKVDLVSAQGTPNCDRYAIAAIKDGQMHLTPLSAIVQMRPDLTYLDRADAASKARAQLLELDGESSQDEEEEAKAVQVKFTRQETSEQKSRRLQSYEYLHKKQSEEQWVSCTYSKAESEISGRLRHSLLASTQESVDSYCTTDEYLNKLIPKPESDHNENPDLPVNVLSLSQLKNMPLNDRVLAVIRKAKVIRWCQLLNLLGKDENPSSVLKAVQQVAVLVQGCWVIKSEILYPKDSFSPYNSSPAEVICRARDFLLWKFTHSGTIIRRDVSNIVKIPAEEMKEMLEQVAKPKAKQGWMFNFEFDRDFVEKHKDVVQRQQMLWENKYQQLAKFFKLPKDPKSAAEVQSKRRRRHSSRSKSQSDTSDMDCEKTSSTVEYKTEATRDNGVHIDHVPATDTGDSNTNHLAENELMQELSSLLRDKLLAQTVLSMTDLKNCYQTKLAQCPPGHILGTGVSDNLLERAVLKMGASKVNYMGPPGCCGPFFLLTSPSGTQEPLRNIIVRLYASSNKVKTFDIKQEVEKLGLQVTEADMKKMLKDYAIYKGSYWYLKGSVET